MSYSEFEECPDGCPGCRHRHLTMEESIRQKESYLSRVLATWKPVIAPCRGTDQIPCTGYRQRVSLTAEFTKERWHFGLMNKRQLIPVHQCPVHSPVINRALEFLSITLPPPDKFPLGYILQTGLQMTLVLKTKPLPETVVIANRLKEGLTAAGVATLWLHFNPSAGRRMFSKNGWVLVFGEPFLRDELGMVYGPASFRQLLPNLYLNSVNTCLQFFNLKPGDKVVDLYCGTGYTLSRWNAAGAESAGVELSGDSIRCAAINAPGSVLYRGKCTERILQITQWLNAVTEKTNTYFYINPPRTGMENELIQWITNQLRPEKIAYLSCSAGTLNRDLNEITKQGYHVLVIIPYDFFPHTHHIETLCFLVKQGQEARLS